MQVRDIEVFIIDGSKYSHHNLMVVYISDPQGDGYAFPVVKNQYTTSRAFERFIDDNLDNQNIGSLQTILEDQELLDTDYNGDEMEPILRSYFDV